VRRGTQVTTSSVRELVCALVESALLMAMLLLSTAIRFSNEFDEFLEYEGLLSKAILSALVLQLSIYYSDLYEESSFRPRMEPFLRLSQAFAVGAVVLSLVYYLFPAVRVGRGILLIYLPLSLVSLLLWRSAFLWMAGRQALTDNVLILGAGASAQQLAIELLRRSPLGFRVVGFLGERPSEVGRSLVNPSVLGTIDDLPAVVQQQNVNLIVVALEDRRGKLPIASLLRCRLAGVRVEEAAGFFERLTGKIPVKNLRPSWLVFSQGFNKPRLLRNTKSTGEFAVAVVLLALLLPLMGLIALLVKLDTRGPVFYRQERVGEKGRVFWLYKFRTMRAEAEAATGPVWSSADGDPRVTRVGKILRKLRLDELPQLLNVLRGEMSFVGPRPERPHFVAMLRQVIPYYDERHSVKPGITGWAQIKFRYGSTIEDADEKLQFDLYYIKHMSFVFDAGILLDTLKVALLGRGAR
jgi:sugar transferase (PEP-CTERM system associated)